MVDCTWGEISVYPQWKKVDENVWQQVPSAEKLHRFWQWAEIRLNLRPLAGRDDAPGTDAEEVLIARRQAELKERAAQVRERAQAIQAERERMLAEKVIQLDEVRERKRRGAGLALILGALLLGSAPVTQAAATESSTTTVTVNIADAIEVVAWPPASFTLSSAAIPGVPVVSGGLGITVKSNSTWGVQLSTDSETGKLREWDSTASEYVVDGKQSAQPLQWATHTAGPWTNLSSTPATVYTNQPATGEAGRTVSFLVRLTPTFDDVRLTTAGRDYRATLQYTVAVGY